MKNKSVIVDSSSFEELLDRIDFAENTLLPKLNSTLANLENMEDRIDARTQDLNRLYQNFNISFASINVINENLRKLNVEVFQVELEASLNNFKINIEDDLMKIISNVKNDFSKEGEKAKQDAKNISSQITSQKEDFENLMQSFLNEMDEYKNIRKISVLTAGLTGFFVAFIPLIFLFYIYK